MNELYSTRNNNLIDPFVHVWGWEVPVYLFLGGLVAGMMMISGYFIFKGRYKEENCSCNYLPVISIIALSLGMFALFLDIEYKIHVWRFYTTFQITSPMSWGSWILIIVYPALIAMMLIQPNKILVEKISFIKKVSEYFSKHPYLIKNIGITNMILGGMLGIYTGILLSSLVARPLWNSSILGMLFLVSGLSSAAAFVHMIAKDKYERELLAKADNGFLVIELFVILLFFIGLFTSTQVHINAANLLLSGSYAPVFWVFVIGLGIVIPLFIQSLAVNHKIQHTPVAPILVILGGLLLRFVIVEAGQYSTWITSTFGK
jgi:protein NrfD